MGDSAGDSLGKTTVDFAAQKFSVYILGAGFSKPAGLPTALDLWNEVRRRALLLSGRAGQFRDDLNAYIDYRRTCDGRGPKYEQDLEEFMAFLDVEFYLGLRGKETWSAQGNETQVVVKTPIGEILTERMPSTVAELYLKFAKLLKPDDYVLTFNYDTLLERALEEAGVPFRLFPDRLKENPYSGRSMLVENSKNEVIVLKMHGSIDWFDRTEYNHLEAQRIEQGFKGGTSDLIFEDLTKFHASPLLEGPRFPNDPLQQMYRIRDIECLYGSNPLFRATPSLLNPSSMKILFAQMVREFWWGLGLVGTMNFRLAVIGFSLPAQDEYARQAIYRIVRNYQTTHWDKAWDDYGHRKTPVVLIDCRPSGQEQDDFRRRYAFVDWNKTQVCFTGFDEESLNLLGST